MPYALFVFILLSWFAAPITLCSAQDQEGKTTASQEKMPVEDVIPWTVGNMRGHKMLYNEGWFVVSSSRKAFAYAKEKSLQDSRTALQEALEKVSRDSQEYGKNIKTDVQESAATVKDTVVTGTRRSDQIFTTTDKISRAEWNIAKESFVKAMDAFVTGNLSIAKRTEAERGELANLPGNYYKSLKHDFSNIYDLTETARNRFSKKIDPQWDTAFQTASREFQAEYEESGKKQNSLVALGPVLYGYLKSFYYGLAAPTSKTIVKYTVAGTTYAVFLPVAATSVTGRTVQSVGLTVYYTGKTGIRIISPTIEGGLLSGMSLLSLGAIPVTYAAGGTMGAVNQVAFTTAAPAAGAVEAAVKTTAHTAKYVGFLAFDAAAGATKVVINQASAGIVLGYNALTAVPTHALLAAGDSVIFLAWDGPRLVIASAQGRIKYSADQNKESFSLGDLPVGTVVDLKKLEQQEGVKVDIISEDPAVIKNVLEKIPDDARVPDEKK